MPISVTYHVCGRDWQVADAHAGKTGLCPKCGEEVSIPVQAGASAGTYDPASLPAVSAVEVVPLVGVDPSCLQDRAATWGGRAAGEAAARVADLWRSLPPESFRPRISQCTVCGSWTGTELLGGRLSAG